MTDRPDRHGPPSAPAVPASDPHRSTDVPLGRAHVRHGHPERDRQIRSRATDCSGGGVRSPPRVATGRAMVEEGADLLDVGGESTRPGHSPVDLDEERRRVVPVIAAIRAALPDTPLSIDTTKPAVAEAALAAGADLLNDVWGTGADDGMARVAADHGVPLDRHAQPGGATLHRVPRRAGRRPGGSARARLRLGVRPDDLIVDPGFGFGKTPEHNLELVRRLDVLRLLGRPILLGASRKSTLGRSWTCPPTSVSRRPSRPTSWASPAAPTSSGSTTSGRTSGPPGSPTRSSARRSRARPPKESLVTDRIVLANMRFQGRHGYYEHEQVTAQPFEVDVELVLDLQPAGLDDDLEKTIDYGKVFEAVRQIVESTSYRLLEALAEAISHELLADFDVNEVASGSASPRSS